MLLKGQLVSQFVIVLGQVHDFLLKGQNPGVEVRLVADWKDVVALSEGIYLLLERGDLWFEVDVFFLFLYFF